MPYGRKRRASFSAGRNSKRVKFTVRRRHRRRRLNSRWRRVYGRLIKSPTAIPFRTLTKMQYVRFSSLTPTVANTFKVDSRKTNSVFSIQPYLFDTMAALYAKCTVLGTRLSIDGWSSAPAWLFSAFRKSTDSTADQYACERPGTKNWITAPQGDGLNRFRVRHYMPTWGAWGTTKKDFYEQIEDFEGTPTADPTNVTYCDWGFMCNDQGADETAYYRLKVTFYVIWSEPVLHSHS